ncbi:MAG: hypothetical protein CVV56_04905 [Tenericutes bacterium HGW-Tenericutes-1]|nr:MAG: hypothetical protein CVV56_04905 [Tenericutes bacterium HGW-Tenericutes-1]
MADETQIKQFLQDVKNADIIDFVPTDKNRRTRLSIGLSTYDQEELVRSLKVEEYYSGPSNDKDTSRTGMIWVFKHNYQGHMLYIKLKEKIFVEGTTVIRCLSCHIDYM